MARLTLDIAVDTLLGAEPLANGDDVERAIQAISDIALKGEHRTARLPSRSSAF
jgi:hypothetical protein